MWLTRSIARRVGIVMCVLVCWGYQSSAVRAQLTNEMQTVELMKELQGINGLVIGFEHLVGDSINFTTEVNPATKSFSFASVAGSTYLGAPTTITARASSTVPRTPLRGADGTRELVRRAARRSTTDATPATTMPLASKIGMNTPGRGASSPDSTPDPASAATASGVIAKAYRGVSASQPKCGRGSPSSIEGPVGARVGAGAGTSDGAAADAPANRSSSCRIRFSMFNEPIS